ncbi:AAA family ATPase [Isoptericola aurantiacus]|uniref:AAA family ATPase n=1 Tax=Isoptericola aurantiacus TaxID=3377839 RepID=UPI00383B6FE4
MELVGRDDELARIDALLAGRTGESALVVVGEAGLGKTSLLEHAGRRARDHGQAVRATRGNVGERSLAFAGLHRLLHPLLAHVDRLPRPQRRAVGGAFGLTDSRGVPDRLHLAAGVLSLLADLDRAPGTGADGPRRLVVVDDLQWVDDASRDVLLFCARRLVPECGTAMLLATRPTGAPADLPTLRLAPLAVPDAERLLDRQPVRPTSDRRALVLDRSAGNPLALLELARPDTATDALPASTTLDARIEHDVAARLADLPSRTRALLTLAAAADGDDLAVVLDAARRSGTDTTAHDGAPDVADVLADWAPAELAGLVRLDDDRVRFRHPLVRRAVYDVAPRSERRGAHLALAAAAHDPDRRAWHLAAAAVGRDGQVADALEATADRARDRGGWAAAARALERAGELSPHPQDATRRFLAAAPAAMYTGRTAWVEQVAARARATAVDETDRLEADLYAGWAVASSYRHADAVERLTSVARRAAGDVPSALAALAPAGVAAYNSGDDALLAAVGGALGRLDVDDDEPVAAWLHGVVAPFDPRSREILDRAVAAHADLGIDELNVLGGAAWVLDESSLAERLLARLLELFADGPTQGANALVTGTLAAARQELGRWEEARAGAEDAVAIAEETGMPVVRDAARTTSALVAACQGRTEQARELAGAVLGGVDPDVTRAAGIRAHQALGLAALADGEPETAYDFLRRGFGPDGTPLHRHASVYSVVLLAGAAARSERSDDARTVVDAVARGCGPQPGPRVATLLQHARALLCEPDRSVPLLRAALADAAGATWPFERALARLDLGRALRRARRVSEARTELSAALETFVRLGASPFVEQAAGELRASGVAVADRAPDALAQLTAQQRRIVHLAARGRTNRQIAEELFLSPRTVGFHLYRVFPLLGVTSRAQLRDLVEPASG